MEPHANVPSLITIVGSTGSGKTALAIALAERFGGEIVCADSRTVYRGMDIGTAKPSEAEKKRIPHHLLDIASPDRPITASSFKKQADSAIAGITARGKVPFLVGGTGLYVDAVVYNFSFRGAPDPVLRAKLDDSSVQNLQKLITDMGLQLPGNAGNKRHLIRQIESKGVIAADRTPRKNSLIIGLEVDQKELEDRLAKRLDNMLSSGLEEEVRRLSQQYGWGCRALQTIGYQEFKDYFDGGCSIGDVRQAILRHSLQYAKRQKTWFKRTSHIRYIRSFDEAVAIITTFLNKKAAL